MPIETLVLQAVAGAFGLAAIALLSAAFFTVEQRTTVIVQRLGKFLREAGPGLHMKIPIIDRIVASSRTDAMMIEADRNGQSVGSEQ
jgi:regulator of protease activity HflC (stomatin/prohibitin superfamily)